MVRVAHLADTHLGFRQYNLDERERDVYDVMDEISDRILDERASIVVHSGDLFDSSRPTAQAYYAFKKFLSKLEGKVKVFSILGDHDTPKRLGMPPQRLFEDRIQVLGVNGGEHQVLSLNGQDVLVAGVSHMGRRSRDVLTRELRRLGSLAAKCSISVLTLHQTIDRFFFIKELAELKLEELPGNFRYYAMGHLHERIRAPHGLGELSYAGSPEIFRSSEIDEWLEHGKGFYIVDVEKEDVEVREVNVEGIRPQRKVRLSYVDFDRELKALTGSLNRYGKIPILHITVEGRGVDRQRVYQALNEALAGRVLRFRSELVEEAEEGLVELKLEGVNVYAALKEFLRDEKLVEFGYALFDALRLGEADEARRVAEQFYRGIGLGDSEEGAA